MPVGESVASILGSDLWAVLSTQGWAPEIAFQPRQA